MSRTQEKTGGGLGPRGVLKWTALLTLGVVALLEVTPYLWMVTTSLKSFSEVTTFPPSLLPDSPQWSNYVEVWQSAPFGQYLVNSLIVTLSIVFFQSLLSCLAGYAFARLRFWGRDVLFYGVIACLIIPPQVRFISIFLLLDEVDLLNTYTAQILPYGASALGIFLMRQAFLAVPQEIVDAAKVDGASTLRVIFQIMIPVAMPTLVAFMLFSFVFHWNDYFWPLIVTLDESVRPLPLGVALLREQGTGSRWHLIMAGNVLLVAPLLVIFAFAQRRIVRAFVFSSVK